MYSLLEGKGWFKANSGLWLPLKTKRKSFGELWEKVDDVCELTQMLEDPILSQVSYLQHLVKMFLAMSASVRVNAGFFLTFLAGY